MKEAPKLVREKVEMREASPSNKVISRRVRFFE